MTYILGISAFYHDSAVALMRDGEIVAAASEERFTRKKHDEAFPKLALESCLDIAGIGIEDLDYVGFYEKPFRKFDRLLETYIAFAPRGYASFAKAMPSWLRTKLHLPREIRQHMDGKFRKRLIFCEHHESHAASAFLPSPFESSAILTIDGVGEWATTAWGIGHGNKLELKSELRFPHSLGLLYSAFTYFCGFRVNSGEYKLMGLAPYGEPKFASLILEHLVELKGDGSYRVNQDFFSYCHTLRMTGGRLEKLLGVPKREPDTPVRDIDMDLAASIQRVTEEVVLKMAKHVHQQTGLRSLCMAGGVALNCVANGRLLREGPFDQIWVQPASGDAGGSLGVASLIWHQLLDNPRQRAHEAPSNNPHRTSDIAANDHADIGTSTRAANADAQHGSLLGNAITEPEVAELLASGAVAERLVDDQLFKIVAELLADEKIVGWVQDRMEFGPRSLGSRSILGDPRSPHMQSKMNLKIKFRESFRPFAPAVLLEHAHEYFEMLPGQESPYMLFTADVRPERRRTVNEAAHGIERVKQVRSELPAITHLDYSARVQTVSLSKHPRFHQLLTAFYEQTACPVLINTSFNVRGEPIVCSAQDAYRCFMATDIDVLVIGNHVFYKAAQPDAAKLASSEYLTKLEPD